MRNPIPPALTSRVLLACSILAALVARPSLAQEPSKPKRMEWKVGDVTREALVAMPEGVKNAPLVFVWHGHGGTMRNAARSFGIHDLWPGAIVVYPQGLPTVGLLTDPEGKKPGWQSQVGGNDDRDLNFFDAMLATFKSSGQADPTRVYATGHSNGGRFVYVLWASRSEAIAAFAPSASPATGLLARMKPKPCLHVAGETDTLVPFASQRRTMDRIREIDGCESEGKPWGGSGGKVTLYPSKNKTPLVTAIFPGGHVFPKEAPALIVKFFRDRDSD